jgi:hypothetical protein
MRRDIIRWLYRWLNRELRLSDKITEESRADWSEAARARAICEAEDAGLRGTERQAFITERTKIHYAELRTLLGDV